jgi:hypothetical protein
MATQPSRSHKAPPSPPGALSVIFYLVGFRSQQARPGRRP